MTATLIYDGECPLCEKAVAWVQKRARPQTLEYLTCQSPERAQRFPTMAEAQCMEAMQLVMPDGAVYSGDEALPVLLSMLRRWRWLAHLFRIPGITLLSPIGYRFIARNRHIFSIFVASKRSPSDASCSPDSNCK